VANPSNHAAANVIDVDRKSFAQVPTDHAFLYKER